MKEHTEESLIGQTAAPQVILSLGSNCGDRRRALEDAVVWLNAVLENGYHSDIYETESVSGDGKKYLNCVMAGRCPLDAAELARRCKDYESRAGRDEACRRAGQVPIDIDVVYFDNEAIRPREASAGYFLKGLGQLQSHMTSEK